MSGETLESPWTTGPLDIGADVLAGIYAHATAEYPSECCGFIAGPASEPARLDEAMREVNEADKYHRLDPERFPRTSRTYFKIHELRAAKAFDRGRASGRPIKVIYHSHCDAGAYFSPEDAATFASGGTLMWPCAFLVVSVVEGVAAGHRLWVHTPGTDAFHEAVLEIRNPDDTRSDHAPR
jgi:proteasome lid subunit RPN8/RPN11